MRSEAFSPAVNLSNVRFPQYLQKRIQLLKSKGSPVPPRLRLALKTFKEKDGEHLLAVGHKSPRYFKRLNEISIELGTSKSVMCYRPIKEIAQSFNMRATAGTFDVGREAIFAVGESILLVKSLAAAKELDALVVPQRALAQNWRAVVNAACEHLIGHVGTINPNAESEIEEKRRSRERAQRPELSALETEALVAIADSGVDSVLDADMPFTLASVADELRKVAAGLPIDHIEFIKDFVSRSGDADQMAYFQKWKTFAETCQV